MAPSTPPINPEFSASPAGPAGYCPSRSDRVGLWVFMIAGLAITVSTAVFAAIRIAELLGPGPIPVEVKFAGLPTTLPMGERSLPLDITTGTIRVTEMPLASLIAGIAAPVLAMLVTATITACVITLAVSVIRGQIFSKRNSRLVAAAGFIGLIGFAAVNLCNTMLSNGALAWASARRIDNVVFSFNPGTYILAAFVIALVSSVFVIGERMQRDTEGLV